MNCVVRVSPSCDSGKTRALSSGNAVPPLHIHSRPGVHECAFKIVAEELTDDQKTLTSKWGDDRGAGIAPVVWEHAYDAKVAHWFGMDGVYAGWSQQTNLGPTATYGEGDVVTVRLDLDSNTVAFRKNGEDVGSPQSIEHDAYYFAFVIRRGSVMLEHMQ